MTTSPTIEAVSLLGTGFKRHEISFSAAGWPALLIVLLPEVWQDIVLFVPGRWYGPELHSVGPDSGDPRLCLLSLGYGVASLGLAPGLGGARDVSDFGVDAALAAICTVFEPGLGIPSPIGVVGFSMGAALLAAVPWAELKTRPDWAILLDGALPTPPIGPQEPVPEWSENPCGAAVFRATAADKLARRPSRAAALLPDDPDVLIFLLAGQPRWPGRLVADLASRPFELGNYDLPTLAISPAREPDGRDRISRMMGRTRAQKFDLVAIAEIGHADMMAGQRARNLVWPAIRSWLAK